MAPLFCSAVDAIGSEDLYPSNQQPFPGEVRRRPAGPPGWQGTQDMRARAVVDSSDTLSDPCTGLRFSATQALVSPQRKGWDGVCRYGFRQLHRRKQIPYVPGASEYPSG